MSSIGSLTAWMAAAGAVGGAANALMTGNLHPWPARLRAADVEVIRPGLTLNVIAGAGAGAGSFWMFTHASAIATVEGHVGAASIAALVIGWLMARTITNEADKRMLRAAVYKAAAAPAADPTTIREMTSAPPYTVFRMAAALEPRRASLE